MSTCKELSYLLSGINWVRGIQWQWRDWEIHVVLLALLVSILQMTPENEQLYNKTPPALVCLIELLLQSFVIWSALYFLKDQFPATFYYSPDPYSVPFITDDADELPPPKITVSAIQTDPHTEHTATVISNLGHQARRRVSKYRLQRKRIFSCQYKAMTDLLATRLRLIEHGHWTHLQLGVSKDVLLHMRKEEIERQLKVEEARYKDTRERLTEARRKLAGLQFIFRRARGNQNASCQTENGGGDREGQMRDTRNVRILYASELSAENTIRYLHVTPDMYDLYETGSTKLPSASLGQLEVIGAPQDNGHLLLMSVTNFKEGFPPELLKMDEMYQTFEHFRSAIGQPVPKNWSPDQVKFQVV